MVSAPTAPTQWWRRTVQADLLPSLGISFATLLDQVEQARAPRRLVLVDACRERLTGQRSLGQDPATVLGQGFLDAMGQSRGTAVLMATVLGGYSYNDHDRKAGVFTAAVIDGLRGEASGDPAGLITVDRLASYVNGRVAAWVQREKPQGASQSPGITIRAGETARALPLAISPQAYGALAQYRQQRDAALQSLLRLLEREKISGAQYDELKRALAPDEPSTERLRLIAGFEAARKDAWAVRGLKSYFEEQRPVLLPGTTSTPPPQALKAGDEMVEPKLGMRFRYIPPGTFQMGSPETEEGRDGDETQHAVTLTRGFWMGETEVTQKQWRELMGTNPSSFSDCGDSCPVELVNWYEAVAFSNQLSDRTGLERCYEVKGGNGKRAGEDLEYESVRFEGLDCKGYRLPTEAEWEYAARANVPGARHGRNLDAIAWYSRNSDLTPHPVGQKQSNAWGLHDMLGNVWEWSWDRFGKYRAGAQQGPLGSNLGTFRVLRGCCWYLGARTCRSAYRGKSGPGIRSNGVGFRLVRVP